MTNHPKSWRLVAYWQLLAAVGALATPALASPPPLSEVNDETPLTVGLLSQIAEATLPSVVSIRIHMKLTPADRAQLEKMKAFREKPQEHKGDPEFDKFMERYQDPEFKRFREFFDNPDDMTVSAGAGVIFDDDGHIVTNSHVLGSPDTRGDLEIRLFDGRVFRGKQVDVVAEAPLVDLAVLKIPKENLAPAKFGDSTKTKIAERVLAIGNPLEFENTVSEGIISAKGRKIEKAVVEDHFQTTAMINPGNSGGALVNMRGEVIGINVAIATSNGQWQGIGFAVPSHIVKDVCLNLIGHGREGFGYLAIQMIPGSRDASRMLKWYGLEAGVIVDSVLQDGPADKAGLRQDDIIVSADGKPVSTNESLINYVARKPIGDAVKLAVRRPNNEGGLEEMELAVTLGERPSDKEMGDSLKAQTARARLLEPEKQTVAGEKVPLGLRLEETPSGVKIVKIEPGAKFSPLAVRIGDKLTRINGFPVDSLADVKGALGMIGEQGDHLMHFEREGETFWTFVPAD